MVQRTEKTDRMYDLIRPHVDGNPLTSATETYITVNNQEEYDQIMIILEAYGVVWASGAKPTSEDYWKEHKQTLYIHSVKETNHFTARVRIRYRRIDPKLDTLTAHWVGLNASDMLINENTPIMYKFLKRYIGVMIGTQEELTKVLSLVEETGTKIYWSYGKVNYKLKEPNICITANLVANRDGYNIKDHSSQKMLDSGTPMVSAREFITKAEAEKWKKNLDHSVGIEF